MPQIKVTDITVKDFRIICLVKTQGRDYSDATLAQKLIEQVPSLTSHKCKNFQNKNFADVLDQTSLPHILEHLIIDYQVKADKKNPKTEIFGTTQWIQKDEHLAKIEISFYDDIVALKAIKSAQQTLNNLLN